jgi:uncharacterized membrane protein YhiD involved in acid resistance
MEGRMGTSRRSRPKRWGLRTLAYLGLATVSILASNLMYATGRTDFVLLPFIGLVVGLIGATVCSVRGLRAWGGRLPRE